MLLCLYNRRARILICRLDCGGGSLIARVIGARDGADYVDDSNPLLIGFAFSI